MIQKLLAFGLMLSMLGVSFSQEVSQDDSKDFFHDKVLPLFKKHCYACHSHASGQMESGLALDWKSGWAKGGSRGPAIVPERPDASLLIRAVEHSDADLKMPDEKLSDIEIQILREWVKRGAFDDREIEPQLSDANDWWSLKPLTAPRVPSSTKNPVDAFIDEKLQAIGSEDSTTIWSESPRPPRRPERS